MHKFIGKLTAGFLCAAMVLGTSACGDTEGAQTSLEENVEAENTQESTGGGQKDAVSEVKAENLNNGYFENTSKASYNFYAFIHLFPNGYCTIASDSMGIGAKKYDVSEESITVTVDDGEGNTSGKTCGRTLTIYNLDGSVLTALGYDAETLYGDFFYNLPLTWYGTEKREEYYEDFTFFQYKVKDGSAFASFSLGVDGSFSDETGDSKLTGTWENSGNTYALTAESGEVYSLEQTSGTEATLTLADGTQLFLYVEGAETETPGDGAVSLTGSAATSHGADADFDMDVDLGTMTASLVISIPDWGTELGSYTGTISEKEDGAGYMADFGDGFTVDFTVGDDGEYTAEIDLAALYLSEESSIVTLSSMGDNQAVTLTGSAATSHGADADFNMEVDLGAMTAALVIAIPDWDMELGSYTGTVSEKEDGTGYTADFGDGFMVDFTVSEAGEYAAEIDLAVLYLAEESSMVTLSYPAAE